jgi:hypothetical protein
MCAGRGKSSSMKNLIALLAAQQAPPRAPDLPPMAPQPPPAPAPAAPLPPPVTVSGSNENNAKMQKRTSKRSQLQQASGGTSPLRITLDKSVNTQTDPRKGSLNIPS